MRFNLESQLMAQPSPAALDRLTVTNVDRSASTYSSSSLRGPRNTPQSIMDAPFSSESEPAILPAQKPTTDASSDPRQAAIPYGGSYGQTEIANASTPSAQSLPPSQTAAVTMVGFHSKLGKRAVRILDTTRALSTRAGRRFAGLVLLITLVVTSSVAMVGIGKSATAVADEVAGKSGDTTPAPSSEQTLPPQDKIYSDHLTSVDGVVVAIG